MKRWGTIAYLAIAALVLLGFFYLGVTRKFSTGLDTGLVVALSILAAIAVKTGLMLHNMSREFWHTLALVLIISATVVPGIGWYLGFGDFFAVFTFLGCFMGATFTLQLGNASESRKDRSE